MLPTNLPGRSRDGLTVGTRGRLFPKPWLRLAAKGGKAGATESAKAYAAFQVYYPASPNLRSLRQVALQLKKSETLMAGALTSTGSEGQKPGIVISLNSSQPSTREHAWRKTRSGLLGRRNCLSRTMR
jgi:hypothetical protein